MLAPGSPNLDQLRQIAHELSDEIYLKDGDKSAFLARAQNIEIMTASELATYTGDLKNVPADFPNIKIQKIRLLMLEGAKAIEVLTKEFKEEESNEDARTKKLLELLESPDLQEYVSQLQELSRLRQKARALSVNLYSFNNNKDVLLAHAKAIETETMTALAKRIGKLTYLHGTLQGSAKPIVDKDKVSSLLDLAKNSQFFTLLRAKLEENQKQDTSVEQKAEPTQEELTKTLEDKARALSNQILSHDKNENAWKTRKTAIEEQGIPQLKEYIFVLEQQIKAFERLAAIHQIDPTYQKSTSYHAIQSAISSAVALITSKHATTRAASIENIKNAVSELEQERVKSEELIHSFALGKVHINEFIKQFSDETLQAAVQEKREQLITFHLNRDLSGLVAYVASLPANLDKIKEKPQARAERQSDAVQKTKPAENKEDRLSELRELADELSWEIHKEAEETNGNAFNEHLARSHQISSMTISRLEEYTVELEQILYPEQAILSKLQGETQAILSQITHIYPSYSESPLYLAIEERILDNSHIAANADTPAEVRKAIEKIKSDVLQLKKDLAYAQALNNLNVNENTDTPRLKILRTNAKELLKQENANIEEFKTLQEEAKELIKKIEEIDSTYEDFVPRYKDTLGFKTMQTLVESEVQLVRISQNKNDLTNALHDINQVISQLQADLSKAKTLYHAADQGVEAIETLIQKFPAEAQRKDELTDQLMQFYNAKDVSALKNHVAYLQALPDASRKLQESKDKDELATKVALYMNQVQQRIGELALLAEQDIDSIGITTENTIKAETIADLITSPEQLSSLANFTLELNNEIKKKKQYWVLRAQAKAELLIQLAPEKKNSIIETVRRDVEGLQTGKEIAEYITSLEKRRVEMSHENQLRRLITSAGRHITQLAEFEPERDASDLYKILTQKKDNIADLDDYVEDLQDLLKIKESEATTLREQAKNYITVLCELSPAQKDTIRNTWNSKLTTNSLSALKQTVRTLKAATQSARQALEDILGPKREQAAQLINELAALESKNKEKQKAFSAALLNHLSSMNTTKEFDQYIAYLTGLKTEKLSANEKNKKGIFGSFFSSNSQVSSAREPRKTLAWPAELSGLGNASSTESKDAGPTTIIHLPPSTAPTGDAEQTRPRSEPVDHAKLPTSPSPTPGRRKSSGSQ